MAQRRKPRERADGPADTAARDPLFDDMSQSEEDFFAFVDEIGPQISSVDIFKFQKDGTKPQCERVTVDTLKEDPYEYLRATWGPGKYWLQFKSADRRVRASKTVDIVARAELIPARGGGNHDGGDRMTEFLQTQLAQQQNLILALITGLANRPAAPAGPDPAAMLTAVSSTFATLKAAAEPMDPFKAARPVIELARELGGGPDRSGGDDDGLGAVAKEFGKGLLTAFVGMPRGPAAAPEEPRPPMRTVKPALETTDSPEQSQRTEEAWLKIGIDYLKNKARLQKPVIDWVDYVIDNLEEPPNAAIHEAFRRGASFQNLLDFDAEIGQNPVYVSWFREFFAQYSAALADLDANNNSGGEGGNPANVAGDAKPSDPV